MAAYVVSGMEEGAALADDDVARNYILVCARRSDVGYTGERVYTPENFLIPKRFPGEPPWLRTLPPARFVAVRTAPRPVHKQ